jgi:hypothetical protein
MGDDQHIKLVNSYFHYAGNFLGLQAQHRTPQADEDTGPVYAIMARKEGEEAQTYPALPLGELTLQFFSLSGRLQHDFLALGGAYISIPSLVGSFAQNSKIWSIIDNEI